MCGIVYYKSFINKNVNKKVIRQFQKQRNRGTSGFGYYIPEINRLAHNERENRILRLLKRDKTSEILFHHRFPTSTANVRNACHPFSTHDTFKHNYVLVHNGIIYNDVELRDSHQAIGIEYISNQENGQFNDSEALLYDIALYLEGKQPELKAEGDIAFIVIENDGDGNALKLHFGRNNGNPLWMDFQDDFLSLASEGTGVNIVPNQLYTYEYGTQELSLKDLLIPEYVYSQWSNSYSAASLGFRAPSRWEGEQEYSPGSYVSKQTKDDLGYFERIYWEGQQLAYDLWTECQDITAAITQANDMLDSYRGKLLQISDRLYGLKVGSKRQRAFAKERDQIRLQEQIMTECLDALGDFVMDDSSLLLAGKANSKKALEA